MFATDPSENVLKLLNMCFSLRDEPLSDTRQDVVDIPTAVGGFPVDT